MTQDKKQKIIDQKKFIQDFLSIPEHEKDRTLNEAFLCPHCKNLFGKIVSRNDPSHLLYDAKNNNFKKIICDGEKEFWLQKYYDDILKNIPLHAVPKETLLTKLYIPTKSTGITTYHLESAHIVSGNQTFFKNLKCFVKKMIWDYDFKDFSYAVVNFSEIRNMQLDRNESFSQFDNRKLVIMDLSVSSHTSKLDGDIIKEFFYSRESKFLPLWVLSPENEITNKNVDDLFTKRKIEALRKVKLDTQNIELQEISETTKDRKKNQLKKVGSNFMTKV